MAIVRRTPGVDIGETDGGIVLKAELPGMPGKDFEIHLDVGKD